MRLYHWLQSLPLWLTIPALWVGLSLTAGALWSLCGLGADASLAEPGERLALLRKLERDK